MVRRRRRGTDSTCQEAQHHYNITMITITKEKKKKAREEMGSWTDRGCQHLRITTSLKIAWAKVLKTFDMSDGISFTFLWSLRFLFCFAKVPKQIEKSRCSFHFLETEASNLEERNWIISQGRWSILSQNISGGNFKRLWQNAKAWAKYLFLLGEPARGTLSK